MCGANFSSQRKYGGVADFLDHLKPGGGNRKLYAAREKGGTLALLGFLADNLGATFAFTAGNLCRCGNSGRRRDFGFGIFRAGIIDCKPECETVRLGTEHAPFYGESALCRGFSELFCRRKTKRTNAEEILQSVEETAFRTGRLIA